MDPIISILILTALFGEKTCEDLHGEDTKAVKLCESIRIKFKEDKKNFIKLMEQLKEEYYDKLNDEVKKKIIDDYKSYIEGTQQDKEIIEDFER